MSETHSVKFNAQYRADGGFRVYTTDPAGLYVSSRSTYAAAEYFQNWIVSLVLKKVGSSPKLIELLSDFDWPAIARDGGGTAEFSVEPDTRREKVELAGTATFPR